MPIPCPEADGSSPKRQKFDEPLPMCIDPSRRYTAELTTNLGSMTIALDAAAAPRTVNTYVSFQQVRNGVLTESRTGLVNVSAALTR